MAQFLEPPSYQAIVNVDEALPDAKGKATLPWILLFNEIAAGDIGTSWTPNFVGLTETGAATKSGYYYIVSNALAFFRIIISPGTDTSSVAGTTYIDNPPLTIVAPSSMGVIAGNGVNAGLATTNAANNRIYMPTWTALTSQIIISGMIEAT